MMRKTGKPNLSLPIDATLRRLIAGAAKRAGVSRADVVRQALRQHFGVGSSREGGRHVEA